VIVVVVAYGQVFGLGGLRVEIFERGVAMVYHLAKYDELCKSISYFAFVCVGEKGLRALRGALPDQAPS
jgi:hypothetical protein